MQPFFTNNLRMLSLYYMYIIKIIIIRYLILDRLTLFYQIAYNLMLPSPLFYTSKLSNL